VQRVAPGFPLAPAATALAGDCTSVCRHSYAGYYRSSGNDASFDGYTAESNCETPLDEQSFHWYTQPASGYTAYIQGQGYYGSNCHLVYWANIVYTYSNGSSFTAYPRMDVPVEPASDRCYLGDGHGTCTTYS